MNKDTKVKEFSNAINSFFAMPKTKMLIANKEFEALAKELYAVISNEMATFGYTEPQIKQEIKQRIGYKTEQELNAIEDYNAAINEITAILRKALNDVFDN